MTIMNSRHARGARQAGSGSVLAVLLMSAALAGCKSAGSASGSDSGPDVTLLYTPTYATETKNSMMTAYAADGDALQSKTRAVRQVWGDDSAGEPDKYALEDVKKVELKKSGDGYVFKYGDVEFALADADYDAGDEWGGWYEKEAVNADGDTRTLVSLYSLVGDTKETLASSTRVMVPLGFGVRMQGDKAGSADDSSSMVNGFMIAGVETKPSEMPAKGSATYKGGAEFEIYAKKSMYGTSDVQQVRYWGDSTVSANFDAGTVSGEAQLNGRRVRLADDVTATTDDISNAGVKVSFASKLKQNGFEIDDLKANAAAEAELANQSIGEMDVGGEGRFYGKSAESVGVIVAGSSENHVITGAMFGDKK